MYMLAGKAVALRMRCSPADAGFVRNAFGRKEYWVLKTTDDSLQDGFTIFLFLDIEWSLAMGTIFAKRHLEGLVLGQVRL